MWSGYFTNPSVAVHHLCRSTLVPSQYFIPIAVHHFRRNRSFPAVDSPVSGLVLDVSSCVDGGRCVVVRWREVCSGEMEGVRRRCVCV